MNSSFTIWLRSRSSEHLGNWFAQVLSEGWIAARDAGTDDKVLVGASTSTGPMPPRIRKLLADAGIEHIRYLGTRTFD